MPDLTLCRVDSRLIHGQVMTKWVQQSAATNIVIISHAVAKDSFLMEIYKMSAPPGIDITCCNEADAAARWSEDSLIGKILLLLPDLKTLQRAVQNKITIPRVQIGGLGGGPNRKNVYKNITLDEADMQILKELHAKGIEITFQIIPEDHPVRFEEIEQRYTTL